MKIALFAGPVRPARCAFAPRRSFAARRPWALRRALVGVALLALTLVVAATPASAQLPDEDYYISVPAFNAIYKLDAQTMAFTPFATGLSIPFYGVWSAVDGYLYIADRGLGIVVKIDEFGNADVFAGGGFLATPVTVAESDGGRLVASDIFTETVVELDRLGNQTLLHDAVSSGGLISGPGGIGFGPDGTLYVSNNSNNTIAGIDDQNNVFLVSGGSGLLNQPGGIAVDGAGNLYVASYENHTIVRVRLATGEAEVFCDDAFMERPNDVKIHHKGGLLATTRNAGLVHIDPMGQLTVIKQDTFFGEWDGVAVKADHPPCSGRYLPYGAGLAGSGGFEPELGGIFSPCIGAAAALEARHVNGGAVGALLWGLGEAQLPFKQGNILVDLGLPHDFIPITFPGTGAGGGGFKLPFVMPDDGTLVGVSVYLQALALDPGAPAGISMSNGLEEFIGN